MCKEVEELVGRENYWQSERWLDLKDFVGERWRGVVGYEGLYEVSNYGRVKSLDRYCKGKGGSRIKINGIILKQNKDNSYLRTRLSKEGCLKIYGTNRLVALHFIENENNLPFVDHIKENKTDNRASELRWLSIRDNTGFASMSRNNKDCFGVKKVGEKWECRISFMKVDYHVGHFDTKEDAINARIDVVNNGVDAIYKYRSDKGQGSVYKEDSKFVYNITINKKRYQATFSSLIEAEKCKKDVNENGIREINKYKLDRNKYKFED